MPSYTWEQVETIFLAAVDLPRDQQIEYLNDACRGDAALRQEVQSLLASDHKSGEKITRAVEDEAQSLFGLSSMIGSRLGSYRVIREIGRGGMGAVYLATRDDDQFQKNVAIKLVKRGMDSAEVLSRFQHERQILAGLDHAYIARLIDAGTAPDGRPFFVMEYVEGQSIDTYCRHQSLSLADRCRLFLKVCEAVSHAHRNLVVHRDLKPGNIFVGPDGTPKLLDFGVAKLLAADADPQLTVTGMQSRLLTPQYASPEQVMGRAVNTSTDVYSLGAVLYELLTGACAQHLDSTTPEEIERVICLQEVSPPSAATKPSKPGLAGDLDNIVMMAMRKDPSRRYQSVDQFAEDIHRYLDGRPILARRDSIIYTAGKFIGRHRIMIAAAVLVVASLLGGIVIAMSQARRAERRLQQMVELANRSLFDVHTAIERLPGSTDARRAIVKTTLDFLENLSRDAGRDDRLRLPLAAAYYRLGDLQGYQYSPNLGDSAGALASYQKAEALLEPLHAKHPSDPEVLNQLVEVYGHIGSVSNGLGNTEASVHAYETALPLAESLQREKPNDKNASQKVGLIYNDLAETMQSSDPDRAFAYASKHLALLPALLQKFPGDDDIVDEAAFAHASMGTLYSRRSDLPHALAEFRQNADLREKLVAAHPNDVVRRRSLMIAYGHVGSILGLPFITNMGDSNGALEYYAKCVAIAREIVHADPQDRTARFDLASSLLRDGSIDAPQRNLADSLAELREAAGMMEALNVADPQAVRYQRGLALSYEYIGYRLRDSGNKDQALTELQRSVAVANAIIAAHPGDVSALAQLIKSEEGIAKILLSRGDSGGAIAHAERSILLTQENLKGPEQGVRFRYLGTAQYTLAVIERSLGNWRGFTMPRSKR